MLMTSINFVVQAEGVEHALDSISELINEKYFSECSKKKNSKGLKKDGSCGQIWTSFGVMRYDEVQDVIFTDVEGRKQELDEKKLLAAEKDSIKSRIFRAYRASNGKNSFTDEYTTCFKGAFHKSFANKGYFHCITKRCITKRLRKPSKNDEVTKKILGGLFSNDPNVLNSRHNRHCCNADFELYESSLLTMRVHMEDSYIKIETEIKFEDTDLENSIIKEQSSSSLWTYLLSQLQRVGEKDSVILFDQNTKSLNVYELRDNSRSVIFETFIQKDALTDEQMEVLKKYMSDDN